MTATRESSGRSLHSLPTGLIKTPWIRSQSLRLYSFAKASKTIWYKSQGINQDTALRPPLDAQTPLRTNLVLYLLLGEKGSRSRVRRVRIVVVPKGY